MAKRSKSGLWTSGTEAGTTAPPGVPPPLAPASLAARATTTVQHASGTSHAAAMFHLTSPHLTRPAPRPPSSAAPPPPAPCPGPSVAPTRSAGPPACTPSSQPWRTGLPDGPTTNPASSGSPAVAALAAAAVAPRQGRAQERGPGHRRRRRRRRRCVVWMACGRSSAGGWRRWGETESAWRPGGRAGA